MRSSSISIPHLDNFAFPEGIGSLLLLFRWEGYTYCIVGGTEQQKSCFIWLD